MVGDVRAWEVELLQSSCFVLSGVRSTSLKRNTNMAIVCERGANREYYGLRPLRGYELKCVYAVYRGEVKEFDRFLWITPGTTSFLSLSFFLCFVYIMLSFSFFFFFSSTWQREREADTNFRIKIFEPYCFAYIFRFAISSGARLLYTKKTGCPRTDDTASYSPQRGNEKLRGLSEWSFSCVAMGRGNGKRQTLEGAIN